MRSLIYLLFIVFILLPGSLEAQQRTVYHSNQQWLQYYLQNRLSEKWLLLADAGYRWKEGFTKKSQYIIRVGAGFLLSENLRLTAGFALLGTYQKESITQVEYRPYQELLQRHTIDNIKLGHRLRVEERFFHYSQMANSSNTGSFNYRFRYQFSVNIPLFALSPSDPDKQVSFSVADELLVNAGGSTGNRIFDQNRILIGPVIQLHKDLSINLTGHFQFSSTATENHYNDVDILWLGIQQNFGWRKTVSDEHVKQ